ncbi:TauD/TfdA family dioxygenase [Achromobacter mucicolens]|uniref:TauD/TfdA family dioxygenase n=1 Tax=Achromobacter mucicolens TaxID=1389922 RepID=UPI00244A5792|nr:TauD/TfdA family dioxygenase [Achromobacter mucicolens]MDH0092436.1 TauD/TfdA family dioxygenase [Achromobacter mucicolens]
MPPYGGDTLFTNLVTAYRHLSPALQALADGVWARHQFGGYNGDFDDETVYAQRPRRAARRGSSGGAGAARDRRARAVRESRIHTPHPGR